MDWFTLNSIFDKRCFIRELTPILSKNFVGLRHCKHKSIKILPQDSLDKNVKEIKFIL